MINIAKISTSVVARKVIQLKKKEERSGDFMKNMMSVDGGRIVNQLRDQVNAKNKSVKVYSKVRYTWKIVFKFRTPVMSVFYIFKPEQFYEII